MLHPNQFEVNEAWIAFRLNSVPVRTELDGNFNCIALMDAASCFILTTEFIPATAVEPTRLEVRRLLNNAKRHKQRLPKTLFVAREDISDQLIREAWDQDIEVVRVADSDLLVFIGEAREGFSERFEEPQRDA